MYNHIITALGREGQVKYGDVTLYAVYTSRYPVPELSANNVAADKEFKAIQNTKLDLLDRDSYAVISLVGTGVSADPKTVQLEGEGTKYFELCEVDSRKAILGHGYAAIGIRLKEEADGKPVDASVVWKGWSFVWNTLFTGTRWSRTANIPEYEIRPWTLTDLRLGKELLLPRRKARAASEVGAAARANEPSLALGVSFNNIFNQSYQIVQGYPMPGFNMMFSVTFKW